jgi:hypothetical protein
MFKNDVQKTAQRNEEHFLEIVTGSSVLRATRLSIERFKSYSQLNVHLHHITLHVSTDMVIISRLKLLFDGNCSASVS